MMATVVLAALILLLAAAAVQDVYQLRISNVFPVAIFLLFPVYAFAKGVDVTIWQNGAVFLAVLALGILAFGAHWLGGGDVKLLATTALWFDIAGVAWLIGAIAILGAVIALLFMFFRRVIPEPALLRTGMVSLKRRGPIPYGIAIAGGAIAAILMGHVSP
jgi:prepilin peptidase CpaA